jgi:hypothetical protein
MAKNGKPIDYYYERIISPQLREDIIMAKKGKVTLDIGEVKLAGGKKSKAGKPEQLDIQSPSTDIPVVNASGKVTGTQEVLVVDHAISISQQMESLQQELKLLEQALKDAALESKDDSHKAGTFVKTVNVQGTSMKIQVQFKDSYSPLDVSMEAPLKKIFGEKYAVLFSHVVNHSLRWDKIAELKEKLGDEFDMYFDTDESIKMGKGFQQTLFNMRDTFKENEKETIQKLKDACQSNPAIKYPK